MHLHSIGIYNIFIINLKRNENRKQHIVKQLEKFNIKYKIYWGWDAKTLGVELTDQELEFYYNQKFNNWTKNKELILGRKGATLSHLKLLKYAITKDLDNILVIEDDTIFNTNLIPKLPIDADLVYLGGTSRIKSKIVKHSTNKDWILIKDFKVLETHAIIYPNKNSMLNIYNKLLINSPTVYDAMLSTKIQKHFNCYILNKKIAHQDRYNFKSDLSYKSQPIGLF